MHRPRRPAALALAIVAALISLACVTACSGDHEPVTDGPDPSQLLADAKQALDAAGSLEFTLSTDNLPAGTGGVLTAHGTGTHAPAFQGDLSVSRSGLTVGAKVIAVGGEVYAKIGPLPTYTEIDPADYNAPDPAALMDRRTGLSALLTAATDVRADGEIRDGSDLLTKITGTVPGDAVAGLFPSADPGPGYPATFTIDEDSHVRSVKVTGPFYEGHGDVTYTVTFDSYGNKVEISAP
ncbi:MAG: LppX_LprAFG lipoprotein [Nocardioidaceae bacterium]